MKEIGRWLAWPYNGQIYKGVPAAKLDDFCHRKYDEVYRHWYFASSIKIMQALEKAGVENYVVTCATPTGRSACRASACGRSASRSTPAT